MEVYRPEKNNKRCPQICCTTTKEQKEIVYEHSGVTPEKVRDKFARWGITIGANAGSLYLLDGIAVLSGLGLAKLGHYDNIDPRYLQLFLLGTYGAWFKGMYENIKENWNALEQEGISTSAPSKALYEFSKSRGWSEKNQKRATAFGYVAVELIKEIPYYAGALGSASLADGISDKDAYVFLAGSNLGAGLYEYGAAKLTKKGLAWKEKKRNSEVYK